MTGRGGIAAGLLCLLGAGAIRAQTAPADTTTLGQLDLSAPELRVEFWPPKLRAYGLVWLPNGTASDRAGVGAGLDTVLPYTIKNDRESFTSELAFSFTGTTKNQWRVHLSTDLYWNQTRNYARFRIGYDDLAREFWGIGADTGEDAREFYGPRELTAFFETTWRLVRRPIAVGPRLEYQHHDARDLEDGGLLASGEVPGAVGGAVVGLGLVLNWDRRDDRYQPSAGWYIQGQIMRFAGANAADRRFWLASLDARGYSRRGARHVLATQFVVESVAGDAPFWRLASLGGQAHSRAYPRDRWLDDVLVAGQAEWRWRVLRRWGVVGFAGAAVVDESISRLRVRYLRPSVGVGLRYLTDQNQEVVPLRLDLAFGHQHWRVSFGIAEAF